jgi:hypothetical protein
MPHTLTIEVPDAFADAWCNLRPASRQTLVQFAQFLKSRDTAEPLQSADEEDEAEWDKRFADPVKMARFRQWGDQALAGPGDAPMDFTRL